MSCLAIFISPPLCGNNSYFILNIYLYKVLPCNLCSSIEVKRSHWTQDFYTPQVLQGKRNSWKPCKYSRFIRQNTHWKALHNLYFYIPWILCVREIFVIMLLCNTDLFHKHLISLKSQDSTSLCKFNLMPLIYVVHNVLIFSFSLSMFYFTYKAIQIKNYIKRKCRKTNSATVSGGKREKKIVAGNWKQHQQSKDSLMITSGTGGIFLSVVMVTL